MKITRQRKVRRYLNYFSNNFGFHSPYQILIDATFCQEALKYKVNIQEQMPKYLGSEVKLLTTACVITEAESLGPLAYGAMLVVKQFKVRKCGHEKNPICASECLLDMVSNGNSEHYFLATQDQELTEKVRGASNIPLLYIKYNAIILEKPSALRTEQTITDNATDYHTQVVKTMKRKMFGEETQAVFKRRKRPKGPNPLSCKKKKKKGASSVKPK